MEHFENEEKLFVENDYPHTDAHMMEHKNLTEKVLELNHNRDYVFSENVEDFLFSWLKNHILDQDMQFAGFMRIKSSSDGNNQDL